MKSKLFTKLFLSVTVIILFSGIIAVLFGQFFIRQYFFNMKLYELEPKTKQLAEQFGNKDSLPSEVDAKALMLNAVVKIYNINKEQIVKFTKPELDKSRDSLSEFDNIDSSLSTFIDLVLSNQSVKEIVKLNGIQGDVILIGEPIENNGKVIGAFLSLQPVEEYGASLQSFYYTLVFSLGIALILIIILIYIFSKRFFKPLSSMKNLSMEMAKGNFSLRVNENQNDEIGELAKSINFLSSSLENNETLAKQLEQTRRDYIANISHELRTPLSAIRAYTETLNDSMIEDETQIKIYYEKILKQSIRLERLIHDMLDLSGLQSGNTALVKTNIETAEILKNVITDYKILSYDMDINFNCDINLAEIPMAYSNADRIMQVLIILLDNAIKYTPSGGTITLDANYDNQMIKIIVLDTGEGIAKEDLPFVFERFYKGDKSHSSTGTGLGLSIAREILYRLNEEIFLQTELGKGSIFTFTIHRN